MTKDIDLPPHWTYGGGKDVAGRLRIGEPDPDSGYNIRLGLGSSYCTHADLIAILSPLADCWGS